MNIKSKWLAPLLCCLALTTQAETPNTMPTNGAPPTNRVITLAADEWCPYNCSPEDKDKPGYVVEIARAIFGKLGHTVEYKTMSYQRAMQEVLLGRLDGVIASDLPTAEEALAVYAKAYPQTPASYAHTDLIGVTQESFYTSASSTWTFDPANPEKSVQALNGKVGMPQGYGFDITPLLKKHNAAAEISGDEPLAQLLKMLDSGRIQAIIDDDAVINYTASTLGLADKIRFAGSAGESSNCFISFNSKQQADVDVFNRGLAELRASGELARILQKYNIKDWKH
ncbi:MAG: transporter substrate-binding domain-containing protein [Pseudomonadales bacterium]|nr:transporter substrate-binding domain-containing protein [Pseudomonadales bacterium]